MLAQTPIQAADVYSVVSLLLTLAGLLGTFFYMHLGDWLKEVTALSTRWNLFELESSEDARTGRLECRAELAGLKDGHIGLLTLVVSIFVCGVLILSALLLLLVECNQLSVGLYAAIGTFLIIYVSLTIGLYSSGRAKIQKIAGAIAAYDAKQH